MNVYLSDEIVFDNLNKATELVCKLPSYCLVQLNVINFEGTRKLYQVVVYCFDDEFDCSDYL